MRQCTQHRLRYDNQQLTKPLLRYWIESSSKLSDTSLGNVLFGLISFLICGVGFAAMGGATGLAAVTLATGFGAGTVFCSGFVGLAGGACCCIAVAGFCSALAFRKRD